MSDAPVVKVTADLSAEIMSSLTELAARRGLSANTVLQQAIATEKLLSDSVGENDKVLIQRPDNSTQQVIFSRE